MNWGDQELIKTLEEGGVVVMPTDTLYGIVGKALNTGVVEKIYTLRKRASEKPCVILIGDIGELQKFSVTLTDEQSDVLKRLWSSPTSVVLDCPNEQLKYLHRGTNTLAFRLPQESSLQGLLLKAGPLIAPSANTEGQPPSKNIDEAKEYFGDKVDLYIDGGNISGKASKVIRLHPDGSQSILRE